MPSKLYRSWVTALYRADPSFVLPIGVTALLFFAPTFVILVAEWCFKGSDEFPGVRIMLSGAISISVIFLVAGLVFTFCGIRNSAFPGSFLYRLTHVTKRSRPR